MNNLIPFLAQISHEVVDAMSSGDKMMLGLVVTGIGILMVFVILTLIILSIYLMNLVLDKWIPSLKSAILKNKSKEDNQKAEQPVEANNNAVVYEEVDDKRVIACISAAVMQMLDEENDGRKPNISFRINSIKKVK